jgi:hypothetical protein
MAFRLFIGMVFLEKFSTTAGPITTGTIYRFFNYRYNSIRGESVYSWISRESESVYS